MLRKPKDWYASDIDPDVEHTQWMNHAILVHYSSSGIGVPWLRMGTGRSWL